MTLELTGADVSNEALVSARRKAEAVVGFSLDDVCSDFEDCVMFSENVLSLLRHGFSLFDVDDDVESSYRVPVFLEDDVAFDLELSGFSVDEEKIRFGVDAVRLVMFFLGYGIKGFSYRVVPDNVIISGVGAPLESFGYGLFADV